MPPTHTDEGLRAAKLIRARWPHVGILVLSQYVQARYAVELLAQGTDGVGYLLKDRVSDLDELPTSVRRVGEGGSVLDPAVVAQLVGQRRKGNTPLEDLTERELEVLALMAEGRSNKAIAERLFITEHTVEKHVKNIFAHAAPAAVSRRPPPRAGRRHATSTRRSTGQPYRGSLRLPGWAAVARVRASSTMTRRSTCSIGRWSIRHPRRRDRRLARVRRRLPSRSARSRGTKTLDNGAVGESARGYTMHEPRPQLWRPRTRATPTSTAQLRAASRLSAISDVERRFRRARLHAASVKLSADGRSAVVAERHAQIRSGAFARPCAGAARAHPRLTVEETGDVSADQAPKPDGRPRPAPRRAARRSRSRCSCSCSRSAPSSRRSSRCCSR